MRRGGSRSAIDGELIDARARLVDAGGVDRQHAVEHAARGRLRATSGSSIASVPFDRIQRGRGASAASVARGVGKRREVEVRVEQALRARRASSGDRQRRQRVVERVRGDRREVRRAAAPGAVIRLCSHVYSSCFARQSCDSAAPRPGASASASAATECTSNSVP